MPLRELMRMSQESSAARGDPSSDGVQHRSGAFAWLCIATPHTHTAHWWSCAVPLSGAPCGCVHACRGACITGSDFASLTLELSEQMRASMETPNGEHDTQEVAQASAVRVSVSLESLGLKVWCGVVNVY